jgi:hypothetical protein
MALIRQRHSSLSKSLKQLTWAAFALQASGLVLMIILSFQVLLASPDLFIKSEYILAKTIAGLDPSDYPVLLFGLVLLMFGSLFTGASGLIVLFRRQQKSGTGVPLIREDGSIADQAPPMPPSPEQR